MATTESNSSIAAIHNIRCKRGDSFRREFRYWESVNGVKGAAIDITNIVFKLTVAVSYKTPVLSFTLGAGLTITTPNILIITKTATEMLIPAGTYTYDLQKTFADGVVTTVQQGNFIIEDDISI